MSFLGYLSKDRITAREGFNRWLVPPAAIGIHLCIGSVYSWSIFNPALTKSLGVVAPAPADWSFDVVVWVFSVSIVFLGLSAAFAGKWIEKAGPRMAGCIAACLWGGGFILGGVGILTHQLWMLYLGYGVLGGCGLGLGYVSPVSTLIRWFPDRRGLATGMAIMGFGGGAIIGAPLKEWLMGLYYKAPEFLGSVADVTLITEGGKRFAQTAQGLKEVVVVTASDVSKMIEPGPEGVYVVGTGDVGIAGAFFTLGIVYFLIMQLAAFSFRVPREGWKPAGWTAPSADASGKKMMTDKNVHVDQAMKTPQFYILWLLLCINATAGIGVIGVAKTLMSDIFGTTLPHIVDGAFAATYVMMIGVFNMSGRFLWSAASDYLGRKLTCSVFFLGGTLLYVSIPYTAMQVSASPSVVWLVAFYAISMTIFTIYGGGFATIPAYLTDIFGPKHVGAIYGRLLTAWSTAGVLGPLAITSLREMSVGGAIQKLVTVVDPAAFQAKFGAGIEQLDTLVANKTVTIGKLMEIAPAGTLDPTATLYNTTMYAMAALLTVAFVANLLVRPVDSRHHMKEDMAGMDELKQKAASDKKSLGKAA